MKEIVHLMGLKPFICRALNCAFKFKKLNTLFRLMYFRRSRRVHFIAPHLKIGFSLVEMLMALLVASLLLAALAPVMTRRMNENMYITGEFSHNGKTIPVEIEFGGQYCDKIISDANGNFLYCEGEYTVPEGFQNITVTAIGAGGGGGTAPTAGFIEFTTPGSTDTFTVPLMTNQIEATLISGGAGGGAGGQVEKTKVFDTPEVSSWDNIPDVIKGKYVKVMGCAGGGGGGGAYFMSPTDDESRITAGGGGSGGFLKTPFAVYIDALSDSVPYQVGGGGGGGSNGSGSSSAVNYGGAGACGGGGDGGSDDGAIVNNTCNPKYGGTSGTTKDNNTLLVNAGGGYPSGGVGQRLDFSSLNYATQIQGGIGNEGGNGGSSGMSVANLTVPVVTTGGGGGKYGGGGGGSSHVGSGGGGGGPTYFNNILIASGGSGGGSGGLFNGTYYYVGGSGGGGGGSNGGSGGDGASVFLTNEIRLYQGGGGKGGSPNGLNGTTNAGWSEELVQLYGWNNCAGGNGGGLHLINQTKGQNGYPGILKVTYLDCGTGGSGGGSGQIVPLQPILVSEKETLNIKIGKGANGGVSGEINPEGEIIAPTNGNGGNGSENESILTKILRGDKPVLSSSPQVGAHCAYGGSYTGSSYNTEPWFGCKGHITNGNYNEFIIINGFLNTYGHNAGDAEGLNEPLFGNNTFADGSTGGAGGSLTTPFTGTCTPGKGGTKENPVGGDASGYGCGGGGGYGLHNGGKGSGGYARISWNIYWDTATEAYKAATTGAGGGGASGNVIKETIRVHEGQVIKVRIGAGGMGARVVNGSVVDATDGGTTIFGSEEFIQIKAGGGGGGKSPAVQNGSIVKGAGGKPSNICSVGSRNLINNVNYCTKGTEGNIAADDGTNAATGGLGASFSYKFADKTYIGKSGGGGLQSTELTNSAGKNAEGTASGGGGAALLIYNQASNSSSLAHPVGGNGANGRIILQLWE